MFKFSVLQRMTLTALMLALYFVATRFIKVDVTPAVRLSAGVAILIFSSILLGPISGALIGAGGDLIGAALVPYQILPINPLMTVCYGLMGALPALIMMLFRKVKKKDLIYSILFFSFLAIIFISLTVYMAISPEIKMFDITFSINLAARIVVPIVAFILLAALSFFTYFLNKRFKKRREEYPNLPSPYQVSFIVVFIEVVFTLFINVFVKLWFLKAFGGEELQYLTFDLVFFPSLFLAFIYIPANTLIVSYLCLLSVKVIRVRE